MEPLHPDDPRRLGRYRLLRRVGEGGMGVVFLAVPVFGEGEDLVAVKAVRSEYAGDREFRARFAGEVDLARRVQGPYTARVLGADTDGPQPWLATEYVTGPALSHAVRDTGPLPEDSLLALAAGLAEALSAIHEVGLVHRDLKPSNVLLSPRGPQVIDFGIARATDATALTRTGQTLGTPGYMSPEQATGTDVDPRSDLFSFGGVLLFAATGRQPFGTGNPSALLYRVVNEQADVSGVPEALLPMVTACLAKDPGDRPDLDSLTAELTGTALPGDEDADATEWLPPAIATTVQHTLVAATRVAPTTDRPEKEDGSADAAPDPPSSMPEEAGEAGESGEASDQSSTYPEPESAASTPASAPEEPEEAGEPGEHKHTPESPPAPALPSASAPEDRKPRTFSPPVLWGAGALAVALVVALLVEDSSGGTPSQPDPSPRSEATEGSSPSPDSSPSDGPPPDTRTEVQDTVFLDGSDRFAALSHAGIDIFEIDDPEPVERLTDSSEIYTFGYSELAGTPDGSRVAAGAMGSGHLDGLHVWDLDESERYIIEVPEETGSGHLALSPDGETLFHGLGGDEPTITAYDVDSDEELYTVNAPEDERGWEGIPQGVGTTPDGELLIAALDTGLAVWDAASGEPHPSHPELRESPGEITGPVAFHDGMVATATFESLLLWDVYSEDEPEEFQLPVTSRSSRIRIREVSFGDGGDRIVAAGRDTDQTHDLVIAWDQQGDVLVEERPGWDYSSVSASPDSEELLVAVNPLDQEVQQEFMLLDEELESTEEFQVPS